MGDAHTTVVGAGRYQLGAKLGQGGMGAVYRAVDRLTGREVAIKRLAPRIVEARITVPAVGQTAPLRVGRATPRPDAEGRVIPGIDTDANTVAERGQGARPDAEPAITPPLWAPGELDLGAASTAADADAGDALGLAREFEILAGLRHPNVISVLDYGFDVRGAPFVALELLDDARTISAAAQDLSLTARVDLLIQLLQALHYLHRRAIVHRDLKPSNVLVVGTTVHVLDFGLALHSPQHASAAGTLGYIAPEVLSGEPPTEASDLYAVGVIAFEILSGSHPFMGRDDAETVRNSLDSDVRLRISPALIEELPTAALTQLREVVERLVARKPGDRPGGAAAALRLLCRALGRPVPAETEAVRDSLIHLGRSIGRARERHQLIAALHRTRAGHGSAWLVTGESGVGKSHLLDDLRVAALVAGALVVRGTEVPTAGFAYHAWRAALRPLVLEVGPHPDVAWPFLSLVVPDAGALLGIGPLAPPPMDPQTMQAIAMQAVEALCRRSTRPVVVILDDVQWAGVESQALLAALARAAAGLPLLIVAAAQAEVPGLVGAAMGRLPLARLDRDELAELATSVLGPMGARTDLVDLLERDTAGNPLFAVEVLRALAERAGAVDAVTDMRLPEGLTPAAIDAAVRARLGQLPEAVRPLLAQAAVIGEDVDGELLAAVAPGHDLARWFPVCQQLGLLDAQPRGWRFPHARVRAALLAGIADDERRQLHARVAAAIEPRGTSWAPQLAHHWGQAGDLPREGQWSSIAGAELLQRAAYPRALALLERALALLPARGLDDAARNAAELDIQLGLGTCALVVRGHGSQEMRAAFDRAATLAEAVGAAAGQQAFQVLFGQAAIHLFRGEILASRGLAERCVRLAEELDDDDLRIEAYFPLANAQFWAGELTASASNVDRVVALWRSERAGYHAHRFGQLPRVTVMTSGSWGAWVTGRPDVAVARAREAIQLSLAAGHGFSEAIARQVLAITHALRREPELVLEQSEALMRQGAMFPSYFVTARTLRGWARTTLGRDPAALAEMLEAWGMWHAMGCGLAHTFMCGLVADAQLLLGRPEDALAVAREALAWADSRHERALIADLHRLEGTALRQLGELDVAEATLRAGVAIADYQGAASPGLRCARGLAELLVARGESGEALTVLAAARHRVHGDTTPDARAADDLLRRLRADDRQPPSPQLSTRTS